MATSAENTAIFSGVDTIHSILSSNPKRTKLLTHVGDKFSDLERKFYDMNPFLVAEIFVEYIVKYGMCEEGLYRINGEEKTIQKVIKEVCSKKAIPPKTDIFSVGAAWKRHIKNSKQPIIPPTATPKLLQQAVNPKEIAPILQKELSFEQFRTLFYCI